MSCFYCEKLNEIDLLFENDSAVAFHHTNPYYEAHIVVVPKEHIRDISEMNDFTKVWSELGKLVQKSSRVIKEKHGGCRISSNVGDYQSTKHLHFYIHSGKRLRDESGKVIQ